MIGIEVVCVATKERFMVVDKDIMSYSTGSVAVYYILSDNDGKFTRVCQCDFLKEYRIAGAD